MSSTRDVLNNPNSFTWGHVVATHQMEYIGIVASAKDKGENQDIEFHVYVDGKDTNRSAKSFEAAILIAIGHKRLSNPNNADHMSWAAAKLFDLK